MSRIGDLMGRISFIRFIKRLNDQIDALDNEDLDDLENTSKHSGDLDRETLRELKESQRRIHSNYESSLENDSSVKATSDSEHGIPKVNPESIHTPAKGRTPRRREGKGEIAD